MTKMIRGIPVYYEEYGEGKPVLNIHGWSPDHRIMSGCMEPVFGQTRNYRRIYPDLPGMGQTPPAPWIQNSDDMLDILCEFIDAVIGKDNFLLTGESYGGYLALGLIQKMSKRIDGVLFLCALTDSRVIVKKPGNLPKRQIIWKSESLAATEGDPGLKEFLDIAVMASSEIFDKFKTDIQTGLDMADNKFINNYSIMKYSPDLEKTLRTTTFEKPSCILAGRQVDRVGYVKSYELAERLPRATFAALDCAGHNLQIESETLFQQLVKDWVWRVELALNKA